MTRYTFFLAAFVWAFLGIMSWQKSGIHSARLESLNNFIALPQPAGESQKEHIERVVQQRREVLNETILRNLEREVALNKWLCALVLATLGGTLARRRQAISAVRATAHKVTPV